MEILEAFVVAALTDDPLDVQMNKAFADALPTPLEFAVVWKMAAMEAATEELPALAPETCAITADVLFAEDVPELEPEASTTPPEDAVAGPSPSGTKPNGERPRDIIILPASQCCSRKQLLLQNH